jgi:hypothetical protein
LSFGVWSLNALVVSRVAGLTLTRRSPLSESNSIVLVQAWVREEGLRKAEVAFITDRARRPLEYWWGEMCDGSCSLSVFMGRASKGSWVRRRDKYWEEVTQELLKHAKYRAVNDRVQDLAEITKLRTEVLGAVMPRVLNGRKVFQVKPGNLEGMITAFTRLDKLADDKRDAVLAMIEPELAADLVESGATFTPDEYRAIGKMVLEKRMNQGQSNGEEDNEEARSKNKGSQEGGEEGTEGEDG